MRTVCLLMALVALSAFAPLADASQVCHEPREGTRVCHYVGPDGDACVQATLLRVDLVSVCTV